MTSRRILVSFRNVSLGALAIMTIGTGCSGGGAAALPQTGGQNGSAGGGSGGTSATGGNAGGNGGDGGGGVASGGGSNSVDPGSGGISATGGVTAVGGHSGGATPFAGHSGGGAGAGGFNTAGGAAGDTPAGVGGSTSGGAGGMGMANGGAGGSDGAGGTGSACGPITNTWQHILSCDIVAPGSIFHSCVDYFGTANSALNVLERETLACADLGGTPVTDSACVGANSLGSCIDSMNVSDTSADAEYARPFQYPGLDLTADIVAAGCQEDGQPYLPPDSDATAGAPTLTCE